MNRLPLFVGEIRNATRTQPKILVRNLIEQEGNHNALTCQLNGAVQRKRERERGGEEKCFDKNLEK